MSVADSCRRRLALWLGSVSAGVLGGAGGGALLGYLLARASYDYVMVPSEIRLQGIQLGLLAGALIGACQVVGPPPSAGAMASARALVAAALMAALGVAVGAAVGYMAYRWGWLDVMGWRLPNPSRHAMALGAMAGKDLGAVAGIALGVGLMARSRGIGGARIVLGISLSALMLLAWMWTRPSLLALASSGVAPWTVGVS